MIISARQECVGLALLVQVLLMTIKTSVFYYFKFMFVKHFVLIGK